VIRRPFNIGSSDILPGASSPHSKEIPKKMSLFPEHCTVHPFV